MFVGTSTDSFQNWEKDLCRLWGSFPGMFLRTPTACPAQRWLDVYRLLGLVSYVLWLVPSSLPKPEEGLALTLLYPLASYAAGGQKGQYRTEEQKGFRKLCCLSSSSRPTGRTSCEVLFGNTCAGQVCGPKLFLLWVPWPLSGEASMVVTLL